MTCYNTLLIDCHTRQETEILLCDRQLRRILKTWVLTQDPAEIARAIWGMFGLCPGSITAAYSSVNRESWIRSATEPTEAERDPWWIWGHQNLLMEWGLDSVIAGLGSLGLEVERKFFTLDPRYIPDPSDNF